MTEIVKSIRITADAIIIKKLLKCGLSLFDLGEAIEKIEAYEEK